MVKKKTVESATAEAVMQTPKEIKIGSKTYLVAPASVATLILASETIAELPSVKMNPDNLVIEVLANARDCKALGDFVATMILGAKNIRKFAGKWRRKRLARKVLENIEPQRLSSIVGELLAGMQVAFFFATLTSLLEVNILRETRTTASGQ